MEPKDFYFQLIKDPTRKPADCFLITPRYHYDLEGCLSEESEVAKSVLPDGFLELSYSMYVYNGDATIGRQILLNLEMKEIDFGLNPGEPSTSNSDSMDNNYHEEETDEDDLDYLLQNDEPQVNSFDYINLSTDQLMRHQKVMLNTEDYMEAAKIQKELDSRK